MHRKLAVAVLFISSIAIGQNSFNLPQLAEQIKNHPSTREREKAFKDLKIAAMVAVGAVSAEFLMIWAKKAWEAAQTAHEDTGCPYIVEDHYEINSLPLWIGVPLVLTEIGLVGYAAFKGCQGAKHLVFPDHKIDVSKVEEITTEKTATHIRVKRENE
jgi:hypothetical protein